MRSGAPDANTVNAGDAAASVTVAILAAVASAARVNPAGTCCSHGETYILEQLYKTMYFLLMCLVVKITGSGWMGGCGGGANFFMDLLADVRNKPY